MLIGRESDYIRKTAVKRTLASLHIPNRKIQVCVGLFAALLLVGCVKNEEPFTPEQQGVYDAMQAWSRACERRDTEALWEALSPDAQTYYRTELTGPKGVRATVALEKAALGPDSMISPEVRAQKEAFLKTLPANPENMTPKDYHAWRLESELTAENIANQSRLFARDNIESIEIEGDRATVVLKHGETKRYSWFRHDGDWKFDVPPSMLRALEAARNASR